MGELTKDGYITSTREQIKTDIQKMWTDAFGPNLALDTASPQGQIISIMTSLLQQIDNARQQDFDARDVNKAIGYQLDIIGKEMNLPRLEATPTQLTVTITGNSEYQIPSNVLFNMVNNTQEIFYSANNINVINGTITVNLIASNSKTYDDIQIGDKLQTASYVQQITDISVTEIIHGRTEEDDTAYRQRLIKSKVSGFDDVVHLVNQLQSVNAVLAAFVKPNTTAETDEYDIPPGYIEIIVLGGDNTDIAQTILNNIVMGTPTFLNSTGGITVAATDSMGYQHQYNITRPTQKTVDVTLSYGVKLGQILSEKDLADIEAAITSYINNKYMDSTIYTSDICYAVLADGRNIKMNINSLVMTIDGVDITDSYKLDIHQYATVGTITVTAE